PHMAGSGGENLSDEERAARRASLAAQLRAMDEEDEADATASKSGSKGFNAGAAPPHAQADKRGKLDRNMLGAMNQYWRLGIADKDEFLRAKAPDDPRKGISDKQLRAMILHGVLDKGWSTLYFYGDRTHVDPQLTARANMMIRQLSMPGQPLEGIENLKASPVRMREVEPWNDGPLRGIWHRNLRPIDNAVADARQSFSMAVGAVKSNVSLGLQYGAHKDEGPPTPPPGGGAPP
ncbi:MAG: hypothetical protein KKA05_03275, partial [Alphaproteobacteria bacterium]|nr:hypothetical protein [Alphaproteobacteria bacterium]